MRRERVAAACWLLPAGFIGVCVSSARAQGVDTIPAPGEATVTPLTGVTTDVQVRIATGAGTPAGRALQRVLNEPYIVIDARGRPVALQRGASFPQSVVILAPQATVAARVRGSVVVIGGDLFLHPGGRIDGDAIAIGGGAYRSELATVAGERLSFRDETFDATRATMFSVEGRAHTVIQLTHRSTRVTYARAAITLPLGIGLRFPSYNRVDGAVIPWGPYISLARDRIEIDPTITYRSDLGAWDPAARITTRLGSFELEADARRATFSNDKWIRGDLLNTLTTLVAGRDTRNYFRADRFEARVRTRWSIGALTLEPYSGWRNELGWSTGAELSRDSHPWSLFGRDSIDGIFRPNPPVFRGRIESWLAGGGLRWSSGGVRARLSADVELGWDTPRDPPLPPGGIMTSTWVFTQTTLHGTIDFPTFGSQSFASRAHAVLSSKGDSRRPPPQRYAYLGGGGTLPTMDVLEQGGTQLFFFEGNYIIPVPIVETPFIGSPTVTLRYMTGAAGIDSLPKFTQNVGARVGTRFIGIEYVIDPATKESRFGIALSVF
jgi:hypothetical protein